VNLQRFATAVAAWDALDTLRPDLVMLDLILPDGDGRTMIPRLRSHNGVGQTPIVVLSGHGGPELANQCLALGADLFLDKPVDPTFLHTAAFTQIDRFRRSVAGAQTDPLTGLPNRSALEDRICGLHVSAAAGSGPCLALIDFDHFKRVNDEHGHPAGDEVLRRASQRIAGLMGPRDTLTCYGGEEFLAIVEEGLPQSLALMETCLSAVKAMTFGAERPFKVSFSAGVAAFDPTMDFEENLAVADRCLYAAKAHGRARVVGSDEASTLPTRCVLVAEDDDQLADLVTLSLQEAGIKVRRAVDGRQALDFAAMERFDAALLDVRMPGPDGFEVLGRLRQLKAWRTLPILIMTAQGRDSDVERAFTLGADDFLLKPFSMVEMAARVRRYLGRQA
jgi:diguanylate cyclase (GGDEF)-like protein